ncbi:hypothetical protein F5Y16DRAFT_357746, partial [Xylariaceae sp. FL0255]
MGKINGENTQAWRKKPRKFAPKSRLGCKTCKIRRVKCDQAQPYCLKCQSTGRKCDGYGDLPLDLKTELSSGQCHPSEKSRRAGSYDSYSSCTTIGAYNHQHWNAEYNSFNLQILEPFMVLPVTGPVQAEAICFFEHVSIRHINGYIPCQSWRKALMYFSQTVPSVRHAAIALALVHRHSLDRGSSVDIRRSQALKEELPDEALFHYNRAIQLLLNQKTDDKTETTAITLLVCYLFTCFDHLAGNDTQAFKHLRGGVELSRSNNKAILDNDDIYYDAKFPEVDTLICQVTRQIRRLDMQAAIFITDWTPADIQKTLTSQRLPSESAFRSFEEAADHLQILIARVMRLRYSTEQQLSKTSETPPLSPSVEEITPEQLETWSILFENMLQQSSFFETYLGTYPAISLLRLQYTIAWTLLSSSGVGREMDYDNFLPQFQQCVSLADEVAAAHKQNTGSASLTFTPEIGIIPVLYIIGAKCRDPIVRREVLGILRRQSIREASWDNASAARVVERIMEIEEGGGIEEEVTIQSMYEIPMWRRIETLSWIGSATTMEIRYNFCAQGEEHIESLM